MARITTPEEWWSNLSRETQDRLAADPGGPVPPDLWGAVFAANTGSELYPPFRSLGDHVLRGSFVAYIEADNELLLARIASNAGVANSAMVEKWKLRARRRGLIR